MSGSQPSLPAAAAPGPDFDRLLDKLAILSRAHLLYFRLQVGRTLAEDFYGGRSDLYRDKASNKQASFQRFVAERAEELAELGLSEQGLRQSLVTWFTAKELPRTLLDKLKFSHVVELSRVEDGATRRLLAQAIVDNKWRGQQVTQAVLAIRAGQWIDADLATPGIQPPAVPAEASLPTPQAGRVVLRFERATGDLDAVIGEWEQVPTEKISALQASRMKEALARAKERIAVLEAKLGG